MADDDVIARAKAALEGVTPGNWSGIPPSLAAELVAELEAARAEARGLRSQLIASDSAIAASESYLAREVAENERLRRQPGCCCGGCVL